MKRTILSGDWHLTDLPRDKYRWGLFSWLAKTCVKYGVERVILLGDATDAKDKHSEEIANQMVDELAALARVAEVVWLPGNHDGIQEGRPFFRFANHIDNVKLIVEPTTIGKMLFLPNTRDHEKAWAGLLFKPYHYIFCHQTFDGCVSENGTKLSGIPPQVFEGFKGKAFSGDIHKPQVILKKPYWLEYVGAPYRIRFGDQFDPRLLMIETKLGIHEQTDLHFPTIQKHLIDIDADDPIAFLKKQLKRLEIKEGDQVKVRVYLRRADYAQWRELRGEIRKRVEASGGLTFGPSLHAIQGQASNDRKSGGTPAEKPQGGRSPGQALAAYAQKEGLSEAMIKAGQSLLTGQGQAPK